jgi:hypothetical protein
MAQFLADLTYVGDFKLLVVAREFHKLEQGVDISFFFGLEIFVLPLVSLGGC